MEDEKSNQTLSGTVTLDAINELYENNRINGLTQLLKTINSELNDRCGEIVKISLPNELS